MQIRGRSYSAGHQSEGMRALQGIEEYVRSLRDEIREDSFHKTDAVARAKKELIKEVLQYIKDMKDIREVEERQAARERQEEQTEEERPTTETGVIHVLTKLSKLWPGNLTLGLHKTKLCVRQHEEGNPPKVLAEIVIPSELCS